eukprot:895174-Amorphochlora_amoeboformis.AAC.3
MTNARYDKLGMREYAGVAPLLTDASSTNVAIMMIPKVRATYSPPRRVAWNTVTRASVKSRVSSLGLNVASENQELRQKNVAAHISYRDIHASSGLASFISRRIDFFIDNAKIEYI